MKINKEHYLKRINYSGSLEANLNTLKRLQKLHLLNVPFENLDIQNNVSINLSIDKIFDKIVNKNRGGFCYELNGLFYELLVVLGFDALRVSARIYDQNKGYGKEFDHFSIIVTINNTKYLTDVGFGEFTFEPLKIQLGIIQNDKRGNYLIDNYEKRYFRVNKVENNQLTPKYIFSETERMFSEFEKMCIYHQTSPDSNFTSKRLITLPTENGRITISGNTLKVKEFESIKEFVLKNESEYEKELWNKFKIKI